MALYIVNLFSVFIWHLLVQVSKLKNKDKILSTIMTIQLFLLSVFRDFSVGADTYNYVTRFLIIAREPWNNIFHLSELLDFEIGFVIINKLISKMTINPRIFLAILSLFILVGISKFIYNNSKIVWLSYFLFIAFGFWGNTLNVVRQFIAIVIILNSIKYIPERKFFKYILSVLLASTIHTSSLVLVLIYPLSNIKIDKKYYITILITGLITYIFSGRIIQFLMSNFGYMNLVNRLGSGSGSGMLLLLIGILIFSLIFQKELVLKTNNGVLYIHILVFGILLNILSLEFGLIGRVMLYFTIINIVLIPNVIYSIKSVSYKILSKYFFVLGFLYFYIFRLLIIDAGHLVPYIFYGS